PVTLHVSVIFQDDFNDGDFTNPPWSTTSGSNGSWDASSGDLVGTAKKKIDALSPAFATGPCTNCNYTANINLGSTDQVTSFFGWWEDKKNYVECRFNAAQSKLIFLYKQNGATVAKHTVPLALPAGDYNLQMWYSATTFNCQLTGAANAGFALPVGTAPSGNHVLFRVEAKGNSNVTATLKDVLVQ